MIDLCSPNIWCISVPIAKNGAMIPPEKNGREKFVESPTTQPDCAAEIR